MWDSCQDGVDLPQLSCGGMFCGLPLLTEKERAQKTGGCCSQVVRAAAPMFLARFHRETCIWSGE